MNSHSEPVQENKSQQTESVVAQKQSGEAMVFPFVDNRPEAIQMRKFQAMANQKPAKNFTGNSSKHPAQRLVIGVGPIDKMDLTIGMELAFHQGHAGGDVISLDDLAKAEYGTFSIKDGEVIVLVAHGLPGNVGEKTAYDIAPYLPKIGNYKKTKGIFISSCYAAVPTEKDPTDSAVEVTHMLLNMGRDPKDPAIPVYGTTGMALSDFSMLTGDLRTKYKANFERVAILIDKIVSPMYLTDEQRAVKANSVQELYHFGARVLTGGGGRGHKYDAHVMRALTGKLTMEEASEVVKVLTGEIVRRTEALRKLRLAAEAVAKPPTAAANSGAAAAAVAEPAMDLAKELEDVVLFIEDAQGVLNFIKQNYVEKKPVSAVTEVSKGETSIAGFDDKGKPGTTTYRELTKKS